MDPWVCLKQFGALKQACFLFDVVGPMRDPLLYEVHQVQQWSDEFRPELTVL